MLRLTPSDLPKICHFSDSSGAFRLTSFKGRKVNYCQHYLDVFSVCGFQKNVKYSSIYTAQRGVNNQGLEKSPHQF